jgi:hypothetical protein
VDELEQELIDEARAALDLDAQAEVHRKRVRELLPTVRAKTSKGPAELERMIGSLYVQATISRWTADSVPADTPKKQVRRKRPGAAPAAES